MRGFALALLLVAGVAIHPALAGAIVPGPNGPLVFTSGRDDGATVLSDGRAQIWFLTGPGGSATRLTTLGLSHHRHASWSPDRTKIAYARGPDDGTPFDGPWDIFVHDLSVPGSAPVNITDTLSLNEDRPSWSPDGTRLAYAKQTSATNWDVVTRDATGAGTETQVGVNASIETPEKAASGQFSRPQWTPDGRTIFYGRTARTDLDPGPGTNFVTHYDIYQTPANGSELVGTGVVSGLTDDYQPALSADGTKLCFTRQGATDKDVYIVPSAGGTATPLLTAATDEYECAWSPDGSKIAFVRGGFGAGQILMKNSDATGGESPVTDFAGRFDGNPEWTHNPPPECSNGTATLAINGFVQIPLSCLDPRDPPSFAPKDPLSPEIVTPPANGNLGQIQDDNSVIYTPSKDFSGTDSFTFKGNDGTSDSNVARVTLNVVESQGSGQDVTAATIGGVRVSPARWRRGRALPRFSFAARARVGTRISFRLSEPARVTLTFSRPLAGRRVGRRCVRPNRRNRARRRCTRYKTAGRLRFDGRAGTNRVRFQGRLSRTRRLRLGRHRLAVGARDAAGNASRRRVARFRIVRR